MASDTKERILESALEIFARDGYAGTNIKDIAESVGIVKSALYRHFSSKEDMWNEVLEMMIAYYDNNFGSAKKLPPVPQTPQDLIDTTMKMINFTVNDRKVVLMRKILVTEQFRDKKFVKLASRYFLYDTREIFTNLFDAMIKKGILRNCDPELLAFSYTAPITSLVHLCDREPEKKNDSLDYIRRFIELFISSYWNT